MSMTQTFPIIQDDGVVCFCTIIVICCSSHIHTPWGWHKMSFHHHSNNILTMLLSIFHLFLFSIHRWMWGYFFSFPVIWPYQLSNHYCMQCTSMSLFLGILLTMWEPWWPLFLWTRPCHTHIFLKKFGRGQDFHCAHLVIQGELNCNPTFLIPCILALNTKRERIMPSYA